MLGSDEHDTYGREVADKDEQEEEEADYVDVDRLAVSRQATKDALSSINVG